MAGIAPTHLLGIRADTARCTGYKKGGSCTTTLIRLTFGIDMDPLATVPLRVLAMCFRGALEIDVFINLPLIPL